MGKPDDQYGEEKNNRRHDTMETIFTSFDQLLRRIGDECAADPRVNFRVRKIGDDWALLVWRPTEEPLST